MEDPDILQGTPASEDDNMIAAEADLANLSEDQFLNRYKATKRLYRTLVSGLTTLKDAYDQLQQPGPMEFDSEVIDSTMFLMQDFAGLLDQMYMASYWEQEGT